MSKSWEELSPKNGEPQWKLTVTSDDPEDQVVSVFRGTREQIADALADSQANANRRIAELKRNGTGSAPNAQPPARSGPKPMTDQERFSAVADLNNPATVESAVTRIIESRVGPVENLRQASENAPAEREARQERLATEAVNAFIAETPEYLVCPHNAGVMFRYVQLHGDLTSKAHYHRAFEELTAAQLLQLKPDEDDNETQTLDPQPERNAPAPALPKTPTRISTGVRPSEMSGQAPRPTNRMKYTREQIAQMSASTYKRLMTQDPDFVKATEFYAQQDKQPKRRAG